MAYGDTLPLFKGVCMIEERIDLKGESIYLEDGVSLLFKDKAGIFNGSIITEGSLEIRGGYFENVSINVNGKLVIKNSRFHCPNVNVVIYRPPLQKSYDKIKIKNCVFEEIGTKQGKQLSTIAAIYLQDVDGVLIERCTFSNIGNNETYNTSAILIGTAAAETKYKNRRPNKNVTIKNSRFEGVYTEPSVKYNSGEEHLILIQATSEVQIVDNFLYNHNDSLNYDNEFIYTKCDNVTIKNNTIRGECGGEGFVCCKPYRFAGETYLTHANIIHNDINGSGYTVCTQYGVGRINKNTFTNDYTGFIIGIKKTLNSNDPANRVVKDYDRLEIVGNNIYSNCSIEQIPYYTSTQRAAIHMDCSQDVNCSNLVIFKDNTVVINNTIFSSFLNLRDFRYSKFICSNNMVSYTGRNRMRFASFDIVDKSVKERRNAFFIMRKNIVHGIEDHVYVPNNALLHDDLTVELDKDVIIVDKRARWEL